MSKVPLTVNGAELLRAELHRLKTVERPSVITAISEARAQGDLSENAEYEAAKERQSFVEGRIVELEFKLGSAQMFGSTVALEDTNNGDVVTYQIVGEDEADIKHRKISIKSPIARALIGKMVGDIAEVQAPGGIREYEVVEVQYI
jgi:transcription elongation factor GreA